MSDIVERLRRTGVSGWTDAIHVGSDLELEAADEIERLRKALQEIAAIEYDSSNHDSLTMNDIARLALKPRQFRGI